MLGCAGMRGAGGTSTARMARGSMGEHSRFAVRGVGLPTEPQAVVTHRLVTWDSLGGVTLGALSGSRCPPALTPPGWGFPAVRSFSISTAIGAAEGDAGTAEPAPVSHGTPVPHPIASFAAMKQTGHMAELVAVSNQGSSNSITCSWPSASHRQDECCSPTGLKGPGSQGWGTNGAVGLGPQEWGIRGVAGSWFSRMGDWEAFPGLVISRGGR